MVNLLPQQTREGTMTSPQQVDVQEVVRRLTVLEAERAILRTLYR
jgi:hypothetical protein